MKYFIRLATTVVGMSTFCGCEPPANSVTDIDNNSYRFIQIGETQWMASDLKVTRDSEGNKIDFYYPNGDSSNQRTYGLLYDFENACKACPEEWRLPTNSEWEELLSFATDYDARPFKHTQFWYGEENTNKSNFSSKPSGIGNNQEHPNRFREAVLYWSSEKEEEHFIWTYVFEKGSNKVRKASQHPTYAFAVRCVKKEE